MNAPVTCRDPDVEASAALKLIDDQSDYTQNTASHSSSLQHRYYDAGATEDEKPRLLLMGLRRYARHVKGGVSQPKTNI
jgi:hypothetical protein